ncbi:peptidyl-prolyl cis-trans isomerase FKBP43-like isoform X2 [Telopea speciosissima]|uniref:peptidyl-prolyl cis-trans isomerase FKBP43-like isoform X2 n=1 Tax=Telopea speciosissima TaxID=54955 RepID=UPI001CC630AD|nr:peptidyl-prolyl cis-trans isomerase FKBP43-like isoform X2 [Telopea speciosissima]
MTFWGIEVRPGKPYTHPCNKDGARLHISQATLSYGGSTSTQRSVVQCNVGKSMPVLLCSLLPDKIETCPLDLEFQEDEEVIFSVLGPRTIYLTGYHLNLGRNHLNQYDDDTESYGEDIAETESDPSKESEEEDCDMDDSFINDGDPGEQSPSPQATIKSGDELFHLSPGSTMGSKEKCNPRRKRLKKKYQVSDSDEDKDGSQQRTTMKEPTIVLNLDSEEEDTCLLSSLFKSKTFVKNEEMVKESITKMPEDGKQEKLDDDGSRVKCSKRKIDTAIGERKVDQLCNPSLPSVDDSSSINGTPKEKRKKKKEIVDQGKNLEDRLHIDQDQLMGDCKSGVYKENGQCKELENKNMGKELTIGDELHRKLINDMDSEKLKKKKDKVNKHKHTITGEDDSKDLESKEPYLQIKELDPINSSAQESNANLEDQDRKLNKKRKKGDKNKQMTSEDDDSKPPQVKELFLENVEVDPIVSDVQEFSAHPQDENEKLKKKHMKKGAKNKTTMTGDDVSEPLQSKGPCLDSMELDQQVDNDRRSNADLQTEK